MKEDELFPGRAKVEPRIYAYEFDNANRGYIKVGYTTREVETRVREQTLTARQWEHTRILFSAPAIRSDGTVFSDHDIHRALARRGFTRQKSGGEWFRCNIDDVRAAVLAVAERRANSENRTRNFAMRPEQRAAVEKTAGYYESMRGEGRTPKFLWNAKMRFGKTFTAYQLAKRLGFRRILILTFKPAVQSSWRDDLATHLDFEGWQFIARDAELGEADC